MHQVIARGLSRMQNSMRHKFLYEYMLGVRQWRFAFPGNIDFAADNQRIVMYYSWKAHVFIHLWNNRWIKSNFPFRWHRTTTRTTSGWKSSIFNRNSSAERGLKFFASGEDGDNKKPRARHREHRLAQRRKRRQHSDHKHVQRQRQNTTITLQMKRGKTDCRCFKKQWEDQATLTEFGSTVHLREKANNSAKIQFISKKKRTFARKSDSITIFAF